MTDSLNAPINEIDLETFVFVERYVTNLLKWDLLTFFGRHPSAQQTVEEIVQLMGRGYKTIHAEVGDLALLNLLQKVDNLDGSDKARYRLTSDPILRGQVIRFARNHDGVL